MIQQEVCVSQALGSTTSGDQHLPPPRARPLPKIYIYPKAGASFRQSSRRPTGNKALEKQAFDLAAIQSLSRAAGADKSGVGSAATPGRKRLLGGVTFWTGLEGVTKTALLLLLGAGVGGLLLPEARAAVAQAKFGEKRIE